MCVADHVDVNLREISLQGDFSKPAKEAKIMRTKNRVHVPEPEINEDDDPRCERMYDHVKLPFLHQDEMKPDHKYTKQGYSDPDF